MKNFLRKAITGLFTTGIAVALFPALTAHAAGTDLGTLTVDLTDGYEYFAAGEFNSAFWAYDILDANYMYGNPTSDDEATYYAYDLDKNGTEDLLDVEKKSLDVYWIVLDDSCSYSGEFTLTIPEDRKNDKYYSTVKFVFPTTTNNVDNNNTTNNDTNNTTNNDTNNTTNNTTNNNTPAANNNAPKQAPLYDDLADALNNAINAGGKVTVDYKTTGDALPNYIMKKLNDNPNVTLNYTFEYEGNTYNVSLNKKNINYKDSIEWFGPLYILKYAKAK